MAGIVKKGYLCAIFPHHSSFVRDLWDCAVALVSGIDSVVLSLLFLLFLFLFIYSCIIVIIIRIEITDNEDNR